MRDNLKTLNLSGVYVYNYVPIYLYTIRQSHELAKLHAELKQTIKSPIYIIYINVYI